MNQTMKMILVAVVCIALGAGGFYAWSTMKDLKEENQQLSGQLAETTPSAETAPSVAPTNTANTNANATDPETATAQKEENGSISGALGFPSQGIPPLVIHAFKAGTTQSVASITTTQNQMSYTIEDLEPGTYNVVAYTTDGALAGGYTKAVPCGLSVDCPDHTSFPVIITPGRKAVGIDLKDWYAPEGTFPAKPQ